MAHGIQAPSAAFPNVNLFEGFISCHLKGGASLISGRENKAEPVGLEVRKQEPMGNNCQSCWK
jgi:hypothetical protein